MMRKFKYLFLLLLFLQISCAKDPLISPECDLPAPGMLCKSFLFEYDVCIGYIDYTYNKDLSVNTLLYKNTGGNIRKTITYSYNSDGLNSEILVEKKGGAPDEKTVFQYTPLGLLEKQELFVNGETKRVQNNYFNDDWVLERTEIFNNDLADSILLYEYDTQGELWRLSVYKNGGLLGYSIHEAYDNNISRVKYYNASDVLVSIKVSLFRADGQVLTVTLFDAGNQILEQKENLYEDNLLKEETLFDASGEEKSHTVHYYS